MNYKLVLVLGFGMLFVAPSCAQPDSHNPVGIRVPLTVGQKVFKVELAKTEVQRQLGLMFRTVMDESEGMLFVFDKEEHLAFWMKNTILPLSVAYISAQGEIREIYDMDPQSLRSIEGQHYAKYALELNKGAFERAGVKVGDFIRVSDISNEK